MDFLSSNWLIALLAFAGGVAVGMIIHKLIHSDDARANKLEDELDQLKHDHELYKQQVTQHFSKTSELVNNLTEDYVKVYQHLAESAETLTEIKLTPQLDPPQPSPMVSFINEVESATTEESDSVEQMQAPKDYAPKGKDAEGTLSESFSVGSQKLEDDEKASA